MGKMLGRSAPRFVYEIDGLRPLLLGGRRPCQAVEGMSGSGMVHAEFGFKDLQAAAERRLRLVVLAHDVIEKREAAKSARRGGMVLAECSFTDIQATAVKRFHLGVMAQALVQVRETV